MIGYYKGKKNGTSKVSIIYGIKKGTLIFDAHFGLIPIGQVCSK
jgi:hypothetical protein